MATERGRVDYLTIGQVAERTGVPASALRFYESRGLITAERNAGNQRRYPRALLRRVSLIRVAQSLGLTLAEVESELASLPDGRTPTRRDWQRLSSRWRSRLNRRIAELEALRDRLSGCIGCGCLSLASCALYNTDDRAAARGTGPRYLLGDEPEMVED